MARRKTFEEAKQEFEEKFPGKELLTFDGTLKPCVVRCPIHGEVEAAYFQSVMNSKHGCSICGRESQKEKAAISSTKFQENQRQKLDSIKAVPGLLVWDSPEDLTDDFVRVPFLKDVALAAGSGHVNYEGRPQRELAFGSGTLRRAGINPDNVVCCQVEGDSMEPKLSHGTTIGIDQSIKVIKDGDIYAIVQGDLARVKYLHLLPGQMVRIHSLNPEYGDEIASLQDIEVLGRVFWSSTLY